MINPVSNPQFPNQGGFFGQNVQSEPPLEYPSVPPQDHQLKNDLPNATLVDSNRNSRTYFP